MHRTLGSIDILVYFSAFHFYHQFIIDPSCVGTALLGLHDSSFDFHPTFDVSVLSSKTHGSKHIMATLDPGSSPSRNPFARQPNDVSQGVSFSKSTILPSPNRKRPTLATTVNDVGTSLGDGVMATPADRKVMSSNGGPRSSWRLLWRGGLELGNEGWRLEGTTEFGRCEF